MLALTKHHFHLFPTHPKFHSEFYLQSLHSLAWPARKVHPSILHLKLRLFLQIDSDGTFLLLIHPAYESPSTNQAAKHRSNLSEHIAQIFLLHLLLQDFHQKHLAA